MGWGGWGCCGKFGKAARSACFLKKERAPFFNYQACSCLRVLILWLSYTFPIYSRDSHVRYFKIRFKAPHLEKLLLTVMSLVLCSAFLCSIYHPQTRPYIFLSNMSSLLFWDLQSLRKMLCSNLKTSYVRLPIAEVTSVCNHNTQLLHFQFWFSSFTHSFNKPTTFIKCLHLPVPRLYQNVLL